MLLRQLHHAGRQKSIPRGYPLDNGFTCNHQLMVQMVLAVLTIGGRLNILHGWLEFVKVLAGLVALMTAASESTYIVPTASILGEQQPALQPDVELNPRPSASEVITLATRLLALTSFRRFT